MFKTLQKVLQQYFSSPAFFILFAAYPIVGLYANNAIGIPPVDLIRPLISTVIVAILLYYLFRIVKFSPHFAALAVVILVFGFFFYGHLSNILYAQGISIRPAIMASMWTAMFLVFLLLITVRRAHLMNAGIVAGLNVMAITLLFFPLLTIARYVDSKILPFERKNNTVALNEVSGKPDIYYIILDSYTRKDVLQDEFAYDNSDFINALKELGFYVAECGQSNYSSTSLSLASSLNLDYVQNLSDVFQPQQMDILYNLKLLDSNSLRNALTAAGYKTIVFASGFYWIEWRNADEFISPPKGGITDFEVVILFSTYARLLNDFGIVNFTDIYDELYRQRTTLVLNSFDRLLEIPGPKFAFIHVISPHPPYVFDSEGKPVSSEKVDSHSGYLNQVKFISKTILPQLKKLIEKSDSPPVIIVQGDHGMIGSAPVPRMKILNAYYMQGHTDQLYPSISPVNTFRVVLNSYFGTNLPLLEDISYYSDPSTGLYAFQEMPQTCPQP